MRVIGMMSGTSFDAIDAAAADIFIEEDALVIRPLGMVSAPYSDDLKRTLRASLPPAQTTLATVCKLDTQIGQSFAELAERAVAECCAGKADLIASHGQTVYHWVEDGSVHGTLQIGQPAWIAERTGVSVVSDFRPRDVAAGGQGAPLVSVFDVLWLRGRSVTSVALNLGGIANITAVGDVGDPIAYDTGPANALLDVAVQEFVSGAQDHDQDGVLGAMGKVDVPLLETLLNEPYYARPAPKSTGKELFNLDYLQSRLVDHRGIDAVDLITTLTALTARTVADAVRECSAAEVIASGGGTRNPTLMSMLRGELAGIPVMSSGDLGVPSVAKEAYAFAVLGFLSANGLVGTVPGCTGARHASVLGSITPGDKGFPEFMRGQPSPNHLKVES